MVLERELEVASTLAREAGRVLLAIYATDFEVEEKSGGGGPVTEADRRANALIVAGLRAAFPEDGIIAEESANTIAPGNFARCWFVDPLDGTREFVNRNGEFAVHIGLAIAGEAKLGVVYRPVGDKLYRGIVGEGATLETGGEVRTLRVSETSNPVSLRLVVSRSHKSPRTNLLVEALGIQSISESGSVGLKCGLLAEGAADLYVHTSSRSYRWDSCAPEALLRAAGGRFVDLRLQPYRYDVEELRNHGGILACNAAAFDEVREVVERLRL